MEGKNRSARTRTWQELAKSEMRLWLMLELGKYNVGYNEVEEFCLGLRYNFKSENLQNNEDAMKEVVRVAMGLKLRDEKKYKSELIKERNRVRREMQQELGRNSKTYRREIRILRDAAAVVRDELTTKYEKKIEHLRLKHRQTQEAKDNEIPAEIGEYHSLSVFSQDKYDKIEVVEYETKCLGDLNLHENEKKIMRMHTKFSVVKKLEQRDFKIEQELAYTKARMEFRNRDENNGEEELQDLDENEKKAKEKLREMKGGRKERFRKRKSKQGGCRITS